MFTCLFLAVSCIVTLGVGGFIFGLAISKDIINDLSSIKENENTEEIRKDLIEFIKYHSEMRKFVSFHFHNELSQIRFF